jgi:hypothetical protein
MRVSACRSLSEPTFPPSPRPSRKFHKLFADAGKKRLDMLLCRVVDHLTVRNTDARPMRELTAKRIAVINERRLGVPFAPICDEFFMERAQPGRRQSEP